MVLRDAPVRKSASRTPLCIVLGLLALGTILAGVLLPLYFLEITPFDKDDTASPPPPTAAMPLAGASASTVKIELIAQGAVTDYTDAKKASIAENVATNLGVNVADVTVTIEPASVKITIVVRTDTPVNTKTALEVQVASPTTASALLGGDVVVTSVANAVFDVPSPPPPSPPATGTPVVVGLKTVAGLTTVEPTESGRRQLDLGRFARRLATRPTGGEYADTSDQVTPPLALATRPTRPIRPTRPTIPTPVPQNEYLEDITSEYFETPNMIMCMVAASRADAMVNTDNQPYLASIDEAKCASKGATESNSGGGGGGGTTTNTAKAISYMAINALRANTGCDADGEGCTAPMTVQGHVLIAPESDTNADDYNPNSKQRVYFYMEVTEGADPGGTYFNGQFQMDYTVRYCPGATGSAIECDDDANYMIMARGTLNVGQGGIPGAISFAESSHQGPDTPTFTKKSYVTGPADKSSGSGAVSGPDWESCSSDSCTTGIKTLQYGYAGTTYCVKDSSSENCFDRDRSQASESVWRYGLYDDSTGARFDLPQGGFGIKTDEGTRGWASYHGIHLDNTAPSAMNGQEVTNNDGSGSYTIEVIGGRLRKKTLATKTLDEIDKVEFNFGCSTEVTVGGVVYNNYNTQSNNNPHFFAYWDASSDTFKIVGKYNDQWQKTLLSSPETVTAAQLSNFTAAYDMGWSHEPGINGWSEGLGHSSLTISAAVLKSADPGAEANGVKYKIESVVLPGDTSVPTTLVCLDGCPTYEKLSALTATSTESDAYTDATKNRGDIALADAVSYTFDPSEMTIKLESESSPVSSSAIPDAVRDNHNLKYGVHVTLVPESGKSGLVCEGDTSKYCGWRAHTELDEFYTFEVGPQDWHSQSYLKARRATRRIASHSRTASHGITHFPALRRRVARTWPSPRH